jgi:hypothetical protein
VVPNPPIPLPPKNISKISERSAKPAPAGPLAAPNVS